MGVTPDIDAARRFLAALTPDSMHTFQTFDDAKRGGKGLTRILHGTLDGLADTLTALNRRGAGIFVVVNRTDGKGRKATNITACRALFLDLDGAPLDPVLASPIPPRVTVESSPGRWHAYWPIVDLPREHFTDAQKALALLYAGDPKVHDLPRVMRLPGFIHAKGKPVLSRLERCEVAPLTWSEMAEAFNLTRRWTLPNRIPEGERNATMFKLAASGARKGTPHDQQLDRLRKVNAARCEPPLAEAELAQVVANAYRSAPTGLASLPLAVMDSDAYRALSDAGRTLVLVAYRRADSFTANFSLAWSECKHWFSRRKTFQRVRQEVVDSGLLLVVREATKPVRGKRPTAALYRTAIGPKSAPYQDTAIGPKSAPPEALQALASAGALLAVDVCGTKRRKTARRPTRKTTPEEAA